MTFSGAFCALAYDFYDDLGLEVPALSPETEAYLKPRVPSFIPPKNPLDLGTATIWQPELMEIGPAALLADPALGGLIISAPIGTNFALTMKYLNHVIAAAKTSNKPLIYAPLGDRTPLPQEFVDLAREHRIMLSRSADRSMRAMAQATLYARSVERAKRSVRRISRSQACQSSAVARSPNGLASRFWPLRAFEFRREHWPRPWRTL